MRAMSRIWTALVVGAAIVGTSALSWAGPLLPSFPAVWSVGQAVAGQSTLESTVTGYIGDNIEIDWIVMFLGPAPTNPFGIPVGAPTWGYYYQIENSSTTTVAVFTITTPGPPFLFATTVGADLDLGVAVDPLTGWAIPAHGAPPFGNLGAPPPPAETEPTGGGLSSWATTGFPSLAPTDVTWYFGPPVTAELPVNRESEILIAYALVPPMYGNAGASDKLPPAPWSSLYGQPVPVPSPEPATAVLLMMGVLGLGAIRWRRQKA